MKNTFQSQIFVRVFNINSVYPDIQTTVKSESMFMSAASLVN